MSRPLGKGSPGGAPESGMAAGIVEAAGIEPAQDAPGVETRKNFEVAAVEPEEGWHLDTGEQWTGYRVRYRPAGATRWRTFLVVDQAERPTDEQVQQACRFHHERRP